MTSPEMQPPVSERSELGQNPLIITIGDRNILVPRKKVYGIPDIGKAIGSDNSIYIRNKLRQARKKNPNIHTQHLIDRRHLRRVFFSETDFVLAVTSIISGTRRRKAVEIKPRGYTLRKEADKVDAPTLISQSIFGNDAVVRELVTNGPGKTSILEKAKQQINSLDPQEKIIFLEKTFAILSDPDPQYQNKRNAALDLLCVMELTSINPEELEESYREEVHYLSEGIIENYDPHGEIHALLEAGKIIAPFIEKGQRITQLWSRVAKALRGSDRQKILADIEEIRQLMPRKRRRIRTKQVGISNDTVKLRSLS